MPKASANTKKTLAVVSVHDVAAYILKKQGKTSTWKLQKLIYYSQAWSLVWDGVPLFPEPIRAWANGPVSNALYRHHKNMFSVTKWSPGKPSKLSKTHRETVDAVILSYGPVSGWHLSRLVHQEAPWKDARKGLTFDDRGGPKIKRAKIKRYYEKLAADEAMPLVIEIDWDA